MQCQFETTFSAAASDPIDNQRIFRFDFNEIGVVLTSSSLCISFHELPYMAEFVVDMPSFLMNSSTSK